MDRRAGSSDTSGATRPPQRELPVAIREGRPADAAAATRVGVAAWEKGPGSVLPSSARAPMADGKMFDLLLRQAPERILVADVGGHVLGLAVGDAEGEQLTDLWVDPRAWGRGLGSRLLSAFEQAAGERGRKRIVIDVLEGDERGLGFCRRRGYQAVGRSTVRDRDLHMMIGKIRLEKRLG
ncbi:GNAT family N-acetyltransferase [Tistrella mobilis]|jgi:ribosomal-protein-alanine N-acetyltransferase|uniref:GNAT family N-acetyltransferase n=1 Tax=Tistrella mobilis TaxID=171437 RepID=UPI0035560FA1